MNEPVRDLEGWTIAFDLDGTLVETAPDLIGTLNRMLVARGHPQVPLAAARYLVGHGAMAMLRHGFEEAGAGWDEAAAPDLLNTFMIDYRTHIADDSHPYPGLVPALEALSARGAILCVATNKPTHLSEALLAALDLSRHFAAVLGPDSVSARKPDGAHIREAVLKAGGDPARALMVGDSATDTAAARNTGVPCVVVTFGYTDIPPSELGGQALIDRFDQLDAAVTALIAVTARA